jgi:phage-related protein
VRECDLAVPRTLVDDAVLIFHAFAKKSQKTPDREIELGKKRLKEML